MSPERIAPQRFGFKDGRPTIPSDCYALGMVIYETISGKLPFHKHADMVVFMKVVEGERPARGVRFTTSLWEVLERCWAPKPNDRPSIEGILQCLEATLSLSEPPPSRVYDELEEDGEESDSTTDSSDSITWTSGLGLSLTNEFPPLTEGGYGSMPSYQSHSQSGVTIAELQHQFTNAIAELNPASSSRPASLSALLNPPSQTDSSYPRGAPGPMHLSNHPPITLTSQAMIAWNNKSSDSESDGKDSFPTLSAPPSPATPSSLAWDCDYSSEGFTYEGGDNHPYHPRHVSGRSDD